MRSAECGVRSAECGVRSAECGMRNGECGVRSAVCGVRNDAKKELFDSYMTDISKKSQIFFLFSKFVKIVQFYFW